jgi:hypothetical protein
MMSDIYRIDGRYPDPNQIRNILEKSKNAPNFQELLDEIKDSGMADHPVLESFFVES